MIVEEGNRRAAILTEAEAAQYPFHHTARRATRVVAASLGAARRAVVEVHHRVGGIPQRALLGGVIVPGAGETLEVDVRVSGAMSIGVVPSCHGSLGRDLVPGLPDEFGMAVCEALISELRNPGAMTVDRAAYDQVESSSQIFVAAADLLAVVLSFESLAATEEIVREKLKGWK